MAEAIPDVRVTDPLRVSVVIPCYRQGHFLHEAIESVLQQTYPFYEVLVIDDASPDCTKEVASRYPAVRYLRHDRNRGLGAARNTGISRSTGSHLVFLDADDRLLPDHFETCLAVFRERPELALVCGDFRWFGADGTWHHHYCSREPDQYAALLRFGFITPPHTVMVRRDALIAVGGFKEHRRFRGNEDRDCWLQITRCYPIHCHHRCIAEYRRHPAQMSHGWGMMLSSGIAAMREQRRHVRGNPVYEDAYQQGVRQYQEACGTPLMWQMVADVRQGRWLQGVKAFWTLLRLYPEGLRALFGRKIARTLKRTSIPYA